MAPGPSLLDPLGRCCNNQNNNFKRKLAQRPMQPHPHALVRRLFPIYLQPPATPNPKKSPKSFHSVTHSSPTAQTTMPTPLQPVGPGSSCPRITKPQSEWRRITRLSVKAPEKTLTYYSFTPKRKAPPKCCRPPLIYRQ